MTRVDRTGLRLGMLALVLGGGAFLTDATRAPDVPVLSPLELAGWIRAAEPALDIVDTRDAASYEAGHVPTARNVPAERFGSFAPEPAAAVVLYGESERTAMKLAAEVSPDGSVDVYVLERGLEGWLDDVMAPRIADDASTAERAAFAEQAELSRWFGGLPRVVPAALLEAGTGETSAARSKRLLEGC